MTLNCVKYVNVGEKVGTWFILISKNLTNNLDNNISIGNI